MIILMISNAIGVLIRLIISQDLTSSNKFSSALFLLPFHQGTSPSWLDNIHEVPISVAVVIIVLFV